MGVCSTFVILDKTAPAGAELPVTSLNTVLTNPSVAMTTITDYVGNMIYENGTLKRILTSEGYWQAGTYYYFLKDHLGSNRVVMTGSGAVVESSSYYPSGMRFGESAAKLNNSVQPYRHTGLEMQEMHGLNWIDNLARFRTVSDGGGFTGLDPLAEKYYSISPYAYCGGNPVKFVDLHGDSLTVIGSASATNTYNQINLQGTGGYYATTVDNNGNVTLSSTGKKGEMSKEQKSYYENLKTVINSTVKTGFNVVENDKSVFIGDANARTVDVGDMKSIDNNNKVVTAPTMLAHETWEQFNLAFGIPIGDAHNSATNKEGEIGNYTRNPKSGFQSQDPSRPGAGNEIFTLKVTRNGKVSNYLLRLTNKNVTNVSKKENP